MRRTATLLAGAALLAGSGGTAAAHRAGSETFTVYAVATTIQFMNHEDDRRRGMTNNPFEVNRAKVLKAVTKGTEQKDGPFPGDDVLYSFKLYANQSLVKRAGSAVFTCYYDVAKHANCDGYFTLAGGSLLARGAVVFNSTRFTLSVAGGTDKYLGVRGAVAAVPAPKHAQRFHFTLG